MNLKRILTIFIGFIHDFAAGCWGATVLAIYWINKLEKTEAMGSKLFGLKEQFFYAGLICVAVVLAGGVGRTFTYAYVGEVYGPDAEKTRRKMLIIKHIVLFAVFGSGIYWQYAMVYG
jgi:putative copper export protein